MMSEQRGAMDFDKTSLRKAMTKLREGIRPDERSVRSAAACRYLMDWMIEHEVRSFMCYVPFRSELDTRSLVERGWETGREVIVPKCYPSDRSMSLHKLDSWSGLKAGAYGILEPDPGECPPLPAAYMPELVVTPGLAFDSKGGRLGYGGGYYDRFADRLRREQGEASRLVKWLGIAFEDQLVEEIPMQTHDKQMDGLVTELKVRVWSDL
ncbi:5-formyltetrahydrofolate cyclo-ligase [Paenibacillus glycanilyticus]|uniref:5-formyltetrahydrofolate cyclo-ligase n=1 Tax=Paenibacillus glycanilyticus TaxID=126569 RepID=UPI00203D6B5F|nr:5-formyltetrahydrofolate cyclo-ligase [Paenibacillus glycanilyticus]MCM3630964.1 5-formyltetrahydrofolate cyclo-ligase [Paenibacillus glycanilyticus]